MEGLRFDALTRRLTAAVSRRDALRALAAASGGIALRERGAAAAKQKRHTHKSKCKPPCGAGLSCVGGACVVGQGTCSTGSGVCLGRGDGACGLQAVSDQCECQISAEGKTRCADKTAIAGGACGECAKSGDCRRLYPAVPGVFCLKPGDAAGDCCAGGKRGRCAAPCPTSPSCAAPSDCQAALAACERHTCVNGRCGTEIVPEGTAAPANLQTPGDCQIVVCTGQSPTDTRSDPDNTDIPNDGNDCAIAECIAGHPEFTFVPVGASCVGGTCDGEGHCVA